MAQPNEKKGADGFEGAIAGLSLPEVVQLNVHNRFSGCVTVEYEQSRGLVFMRDGEIIHAEQGGKIGEEAFVDILGWPAGRFSLQPNVATTRNSIQKPWQHLLLEAHRVLDERRAGRGTQPPPLPMEPPAKQRTAASVLERLRQIPGHVYAVVQGKDGARIGDDSYEAEVLAGQAIYLSMVGKQLGSIFRAGEIHSAMVQGTTRHLLLYATRSQYLSVLVDGERRVGAVDAEIRKILSGNL